MMLKLASFLGSAAFLAAAIGVSGQSPERSAAVPGGRSGMRELERPRVWGGRVGGRIHARASRLTEDFRHGHRSQPSVVLPRPGRQQTVRRLEHPVRSLAA